MDSRFIAIDFNFVADLAISSIMASTSSRQVDKISAHETRPVEMQVLCLGLSRTGTMCASSRDDLNMIYMLTGSFSTLDGTEQTWLQIVPFLGDIQLRGEEG